MIDVSKEVREFLEKEIFPKMGITEINEDNQDDIVDFVVDYYEVPLAQSKEDGIDYDKKLLDIAAKTVTEITSDFMDDDSQELIKRENIFSRIKNKYQEYIKNKKKKNK